MSVALTIFVGYLLGDLMSGIFHWWEDRYGDPAWPILGKLIVQANVEHHRYPSNTCRRTYWYRSGSSVMATLPLIVLCFWLEWYVLAVGLIVLSQANEVHSWAHQRMGRLIRSLQWTGLLVSPKHHWVHHRRPYTQRYCVISAWLNPILGRIRLWRGLEWIILHGLRIRTNPARLIY